MNKKCYLIAILTITLASCFNFELELAFSQYQKKFNKTYNSQQEHNMRKTIFAEKLEKIKKINTNPNSTWRATFSELTDRTQEELNSLYGLIRSKGLNAKPLTFLEEDIQLPKEVDHREIYTNEARDQQSCGSCWAFAIAGLVESHYALKYKKNISLSTQQLTDCVPNFNHCGGSGGCRGSTIEDPLRYVSQYGLVKDEDYTYLAHDQICQIPKILKPVVTIEGFESIPLNNYDAMMKAVAKGPVAIGIDASLFHMYHNGVFDPESEDCSTINHAVFIVGYGEDKVDGPYWIVRNSWGPKFGENGYIRIKRERNASEVKCYMDKNPQDGFACEGDNTPIEVCGTCGILYQGTYPVGVKSS
jgi:cathepsin L